MIFHHQQYTPTAQDIAIAHRVLDRCRDSFKTQVTVKIAILEQAKTELLAGHLNPELQQLAKESAHKLAGSMGTFGYSEGSKLGRKIEHLLKKEETLTPEEITLFSQLIIQLQEELTKPPIPPSHHGPSCAKDIDVHE